MSITVTLNAYTDAQTKAPVLEDTTVTLNPSSVPEGWTAITDGTRYTFKTTGLAARNNDGELHYFVTEAKVEGYKDPVYGYIDSRGKIIPSGESVTMAEDGKAIVNIPENAVTLPSAGGIGTTLFYIVGSILVIGAAVVLITRRRMNDQ